SSPWAAPPSTCWRLSWTATTYRATSCSSSPSWWSVRRRPPPTRGRSLSQNDKPSVEFLRVHCRVTYGSRHDDDFRARRTPARLLRLVAERRAPPGLPPQLRRPERRRHRRPRRRPLAARLPARPPRRRDLVPPSVRLAPARLLRLVAERRDLPGLPPRLCRRER